MLVGNESTINEWLLLYISRTEPLYGMSVDLSGYSMWVNWDGDYQFLPSALHSRLQTFIPMLSVARHSLEDSVAFHSPIVW